MSISIGRQVQVQVYKMASESLRSTSPRRSPTPVPARLQLPSGKEVSEILQQMCGEISQSTTAEIVEIANSADSESKLRDLMPVYFYSWQLRSPEAVITHLLLHYFILWRDCSELRRDRQVFEEHIKRLKGRVQELEIRGPNTETGGLTKQVHDLKMKNKKLQSAHDEVSVLIFAPLAIYGVPVCLSVSNWWISIFVLELRQSMSRMSFRNYFKPLPPKEDAACCS